MAEGDIIDVSVEKVLLDAINYQSMDRRPDDALPGIRDTHAEKVALVQADLNEHLLFPDAIKREIYQQLVEAGEIIVERDDAAKLSLASQILIDTEFNERLGYYQDKIIKLSDIVYLAQSEIDLRDSKLVIREKIRL